MIPFVFRGTLKKYHHQRISSQRHSSKDDDDTKESLECLLDVLVSFSWQIAKGMVMEPNPTFKFFYNSYTAV